MEKTPRKNSLSVYVTTCTKREYLLEDFDYLFKRFWGGEYRVLSGDKAYSTQLKEHLEKLEDEYFILLHEDFYIRKKVNLEQLRALEKYALKHKPARIGLQAVSDGYESSVNLHSEADGIKLFSLNHKHNYKLSFEASIYNRKYLLKYLRDGWDAGETEVNASYKARESEELVLLTKEPTVVYKDAIIGGQTRIKKIKGEYKLLTQGPNNEDLWANLL